MVQNIVIIGIILGIILLGVFFFYRQRERERIEQENAARIRDELERQARKLNIIPKGIW